MADSIDQEAKRRGTTREALIAYYMNRMKPAAPVATGQGARPVAQPKPRVDNRSVLQRLLDGLSGSASGQ